MKQTGALFLLVGACQVVTTPDGSEGAPPRQSVTVRTAEQVSPSTDVPVTTADSLHTFAQTHRGPRPAYLHGTTQPVLEQTAAIVRGKVLEISYSFTERLGPRTNVSLDHVSTLAGPSMGTRITLRRYGGPLPNGHQALVAELPTFARDTEYVIFLANYDWAWSPVVGSWALRVESLNGREVLLTQQGAIVEGLDAQGLVAGPPIAAAVGLDQKDPFARTPLSAVTEAALSRALTAHDLAELAKKFWTPTMRSTSFDGAFVDQPSVEILGGRWNAIPALGATSTAGGSK